MEYLEGETLQDRIRKRGKLSADETVNIVSQICGGLTEAHSKGTVHRDIKPANIFLATNTGQEVVKILDFGMATMKADMDRLRKVSGSPAYMSPEHFKAETIDERSDIYALGCLIFECLTGRRLFRGASINDVMVAHLDLQPNLDGLPTAAKAFEGIIEMCVAKESANRFSDVSALKDAIAKRA